MATPGSIDLTAQPLPSGALQSDELLLERYTRETTQLGKQAQPMSDVVRSLRGVVEEMRGISTEVARMGDSFRSFSTSFREGLSRISEEMKSIQVGGSQRPGSPTVSAPQNISNVLTPAIIGAISASVISKTLASIPVARSIATANIIDSSVRGGSVSSGGVLPGRVAGVVTTKPVVPSGAVQVRDKLTTPEGKFDLNTATVEEIVAAKLPRITENKAKEIVEAREKSGPFDLSDIGTSLREKGVKGFPPGGTYAMNLQDAIDRNDEAKNRRATPQQQFLADSAARTKELQNQLGIEQQLTKVERERAALAATSKGASALEKEKHWEDQLLAAIAAREARKRSADTLDEARRAKVASQASSVFASSPEGRRQLDETAFERMRTRAFDARTRIAGLGADSTQIGSPEHKVALGLESTEGSIKRQNDLRNEIQLVREKQRWQSSPEGVKSLKQEKELQQELNRELAKNRWRDMVAEKGNLGAFFASLRENTQGLRDSLVSIGQLGSTVFTFGTGLASSMSSISSPVEWQTFKRSIEGVAASVGVVFAPALNEMSLRLQMAADWFRNLDDSTKVWIGRVAVGTIAIAGFVMVGTRLLPLLAAIGSGFLTAASRMDLFLTSTLRFNPVVSALAVIATGAAAIGVAFWGASRAVDAFNQNRREANVDPASDPRRLEQTINAISDPAAQARIRRAGTPEATQQEINRYRDDLNRRIASAETERLRAVGTSEQERAGQQEAFETRLPAARERIQQYDRSVVAAMQRSMQGGGLPRSAEELRRERESVAARIAAEAYPIAPPMPFETREQREARIQATEAQRTRLATTLMGRDPGIPTSVASTEAQRQLDRLQRERDAINTAFGPGRELRQSLQGLLPQPQMFQDAAQFGEQLTLKSLERQGAQDTYLLLQRLEAIVNAIGQTLQSIDTRSDPSNLMRVWGPTPETGRP